MEVGLLEELSPAETYYIINSENVDQQRMLKLVLMDLHLKKTLRFTMKPGSFQGTNVPADVISVGFTNKNLETSKRSRNWHAPFFRPFRQDTELEYMLLQYLRALLKETGELNLFLKGNVVKNGPLKHYYKANGLKRLLGGAGTLSEEGKELKVQVLSTLNRLENLLPSLLSNDPELAKELLKKIGGNSLMLRVGASLFRYAKQDLDASYGGNSFVSAVPYEIDYDYITCFDPEFLKGLNYYVNWVLNSIKFKRRNSFDDAIDDFTSGGGSGCGSGCSGCGGCAGCGGCGGD